MLKPFGNSKLAGLIGSIKKLAVNSPLKVWAFAATFAVTGTVLILATQAATRTAGHEAENGNRSGNATVGNDSQASGGQFVHFRSTTTPPITTSDFDLPNTNYSIPAGARFVKPNGDDSKDCSTEVNACATITRGVAATPTDGTLVLRGGVYRERVGGPSGKITRPITIQAYPNEKPWIDGSVVLGRTGWVTDASTGGWVWNNWNPPELCRTGCLGSAVSDGVTHYVDGSASNGTQAPNPAAKYVDQVFYNGNSLTQVANKSELVTGKFYIDYTTNQIFIKDNPTLQNSTLEASMHAVAINSNGVPNISLKGIGIRRFASTSAPGKDPAAVMLSADAFMENSVVIESAGSGIALINTTNVTLKNLKVGHNGFVGLRGNGGNGLKIIGGRYAYNNTELFANGTPAAVAAGIKITSATNFIVEDTEIDSNRANGLWCDIRCDDAKWIRNYIHDNELAGMMYEISQDGSIASNRVVNNNTRRSGVGGGIKIASSANTNVFNNTLIDNHNQLVATFDGRTVAGTSTYIQGNSIMNNLLVRSGTSGIDTANQLIYALQSPTTPPTTQEFFLPSPPGGINFNGYWRPATTSPSNLAYFNNKVVAKLSLKSLADLQAQGYERNGKYGDATDTPQPIRDIANKDHRLTAAGAAKYTGATLSAGQVAIICTDLPANCIPTGVPVSMGYLK